MSMLSEPLKRGKWLPEWDEALSAFIGLGMTFCEAIHKVNQQFGTTFSRNAAVGRASRISLKSLNPPTPRTGFPQAPRKRPEPRPKAAPKPAILPAELIRMRCEEVIPLHLSLLELEPWSCRFPFGDSQFTFCGHVKIDGSAYCSAHYHLTRGDGTRSERAAI